MKTKKPKLIYCDLYMVNVLFYEGTSEVETCKSLKEYYNINCDPNSLKDVNGSTLGYSASSIYVIWTRGKGIKSLSTLAHESLHATNMILSDRGVRVDLENDEAQAYLLGFIVKKCTQG